MVAAVRAGDRRQGSLANPDTQSLAQHAVFTAQRWRSHTDSVVDLALVVVLAVARAKRTRHRRSGEHGLKTVTSTAGERANSTQKNTQGERDEARKYTN